MTDQHEDPKFEQWLKDAAKAYHNPPSPPRDEMWLRIEAARRNKQVFELRPWMRWALAAAVLALGIGIGRWTAHQPSVTSTPVAALADTGAPPPDVAYQIATTQYLSRTETFLTAFRSDLPTGTRNGRFASQARDLLTSTRMLLDSRAANDPRLRSLLEDLELVLVQISQLGGGAGRDADFITQGMDHTNVLPKLRSAIPAGPVPVRTEGAL